MDWPVRLSKLIPAEYCILSGGGAVRSAQVCSQADVSGVAKLYCVNHMVQNLQECILGTLTFHCDGV